MIAGVRIKFCGLRSLVDAELADQLGADYLGFILHAASPRAITREDFRRLKPNLPEGRKRVAVVVEPELAELAALRDAGFDRCQLHFRADRPIEQVAAWSEQIGRDQLWLAPKRAPGVSFDPRWLAWADTFLLDTHAEDRFGGTGRTGDWPEFARLQAAYPERAWVLAGGLTSDNVGTALGVSKATFIDVSSGVELAPGIKDHAKMKQFVRGVHQQRAAGTSA